MISIINLKGGVGKSTLTMLLGEYLAFRHSHYSPVGKWRYNPITGTDSLPAAQHDNFGKNHDQGL